MFDGMRWRVCDFFGMIGSSINNYERNRKKNVAKGAEVRFCVQGLSFFENGCCL